MKPKLVNDVRGMYAYTGTYKNKKVTVMAHGMGMPSIGIYSHELFAFYKVNTIIRIGSAGSFVKNANVGSVIIADEAYSNSDYAREVGIKTPNHTLKATPKTLALCKKVSAELKIKSLVGKILSEDAFYSATPWNKRMLLSKGLLGVEMEAFALYANAIRNKKNALCILTVSDSFISNKSMTPEERQTSLKDMVVLGLETAIRI
jgi:purine-nucleoside phosphorylase